MAADRADKPERIGRLGRVFEQPALEFGIGPGARDDAGAVMRPEGTEGWTEEELARLVTRDSMVGTGLPKSPAELAEGGR